MLVTIELRWSEACWFNLAMILVTLRILKPQKQDPKLWLS